MTPGSGMTATIFSRLMLRRPAAATAFCSKSATTRRCSTITAVYGILLTMSVRRARRLAIQEEVR